MSVRARFWIQKITKQATGPDAVVRPSQMPGANGNVEWSKYTPSGSITMTVSADAAGKWFESMLGKDVAITFDAVPDAG
jgi:hypothetical protein